QPAGVAGVGALLPRRDRPKEGRRGGGAAAVPGGGRDARPERRLSRGDREAVQVALTASRRRRSWSSPFQNASTPSRISRPAVMNLSSLRSIEKYSSSSSVHVWAACWSSTRSCQVKDAIGIADFSR